MLGDLLQNGKVALAFLTRLPVGHRHGGVGDLAASVVLFPLVGALVGLAGALAFGVAIRLALPTWPAAVSALVVTIALTGALHEDGLADVADGLGGRTRQDRLRIMRDPQIGSFGAMALVLALLARASAIAALAAPLVVGAVLIAVGSVSRALLPALMTALSPARTDGLAATAGRPHPARVAAGMAVATLLSLLLLSPAVALTGLVGAMIGAAAVGAWARWRLGGVTGDVLGAAQQLAEIGFLFGALIAMGR
jgi:adenosylcobinamide-GDP ribazoletransferase